MDQASDLLPKGQAIHRTCFQFKPLCCGLLGVARELSNYGVLASEILVERTYADARPGGNGIGIGCLDSMFFQNASGRFQNSSDGMLRADLLGDFPGSWSKRSGHKECESTFCEQSFINTSANKATFGNRRRFPEMAAHNSG